MCHYVHCHFFVSKVHSIQLLAIVSSQITLLYVRRLDKKALLTFSIKSCPMAYSSTQCFLVHQMTTMIPKLLNQSQTSFSHLSFTQSQMYASYTMPPQCQSLKKHFVQNFLHTTVFTAAYLSDSRREVDENKFCVGSPFNNFAFWFKVIHVHKKRTFFKHVHYSRKDSKKLKKMLIL